MVDNTASASTVDVESASGSLDMSGAFDTVKVETMSGDVLIDSKIVPGSLKAETVSGSITIKVPNEGSITVHHSSISGRFSSDIPVITQNSGAQFEISTVSGSCKIINN